MLILDFDTVAELTSFSVRGKSYAATEGNHDDMVMTLVLFSWMTTQRYFKDLLDQDLRLKLFEERMRQLEDEVLPLGFVSDGTEEDIFIDSDGESTSCAGGTPRRLLYPEKEKSTNPNFPTDDSIYDRVQNDPN